MTSLSLLADRTLVQDMYTAFVLSVILTLYITVNNLTVMYAWSTRLHSYLDDYLSSWAQPVN